MVYNMPSLDILILIKPGLSLHNEKCFVMINILESETLANMTYCLFSLPLCVKKCSCMNYTTATSDVNLDETIDIFYV